MSIFISLLSLLVSGVTLWQVNKTLNTILEWKNEPEPDLLEILMEGPKFTLPTNNVNEKPSSGPLERPTGFA